MVGEGEDPLGIMLVRVCRSKIQFVCLFYKNTNGNSSRLFLSKFVFELPWEFPSKGPFTYTLMESERKF